LEARRESDLYDQLDDWLLYSINNETAQLSQPLNIHQQGTPNHDPKCKVPESKPELSRLSHNPLEPWRSWLDSSESTWSRMDTPPLAQASSSVPRLPQKTSGPFNTDLTDVTSPVASVPDFLSLDSLFTDEEHNLFGTSSSLPQIDNTTMIKAEVAADSLVDISDLEGTLDFDLGKGSDFLENFTDLTNYFMDTETTDKAEAPAVISLEEPMTLDESAILDEMFKSLAPVAIDTNPVDVAPPVEEGRNQKSRKRKAVTAPKVARPAEDDGDVFTVAECSSDHSYTAKRRRVSTVVAMETISAAESDDEETATPSKEQKYLERRRKNNIASKRSRETRKQKFTAMEQQAIDLEKANEDLRAKVTQLEELAKEMKDALIKRLAKSK
jgi:hypothetical protein